MSAAPSSCPPQSTPADLDKVYERYREEIGAEGELIHRRMTWLLTSQGLLFAAFGTVALKTSSSGTTPTNEAQVQVQQAPPPKNDREDARLAVTVVGLVVAVSLTLAILAAIWATDHFRNRLEEIIGCDKTNVDRFPQIGREASKGGIVPIVLGRSTAVFIPTVFIGTWSFLISGRWRESLGLSVLIFFFLVACVVKGPGARRRKPRLRSM